MSNRLFLSTYFGPIDYFAHISQSNKIIIEVEDNYQKQSYRNRCYIYGANGKLNLNVPIKHRRLDGLRRKTKDTLIANEFDWQKLHWKSMQSAYQSSPYFEYYEYDFKHIFEKKYKFLIDLNMDALAIVRDFLQESWSIEKTTSYEAIPTNMLDMRDEFSTKKKSKVEVHKYTQVFSSKLGFIPNLSVLDLIFMEGPSAINILKGIKL